MIGDLNADGGNTWGYGGLGLAMTGFGDFIFQAMFAATGATIVSGAVAERVKLSSFHDFCSHLRRCCSILLLVHGTGVEEFLQTWDSRILQDQLLFTHLVDSVL